MALSFTSLLLFWWSWFSFSMFTFASTCLVQLWMDLHFSFIYIYTHIHINFSFFTKLCTLLLYVQLINCGCIRCSKFFLLSMIGLIHSLANCSKQNKIFQNLWHSTYESCQLQLLILKTKLKQKNLKLSLDEMHTKEKFNKLLAHSPPCYYLKKWDFTIENSKNLTSYTPSYQENNFVKYTQIEVSYPYLKWPLILFLVFTNQI